MEESIEERIKELEKRFDRLTIEYEKISDEKGFMAAEAFYDEYMFDISREISELKEKKKAKSRK